MAGWVQRTCRISALVAVAGMAACSGPGDAAPRQKAAEAAEVVEAAPTTAEPVPVRETEMAPVDDHGTVDQGNRVVVGHAAPEVDVGFFFNPSPHPGPAVLQFGPVTSPANCIAHASLRVTIPGGASSVPIAVYPGVPATAPRADGQTLPSWGTLLDNRPRGVFVEEGGVAVADVTDLVRTWVGGGPFPSRGRTVDPALPLMLVVQPEAAVSTQTFRLHLTEAGATAPKLTIATTC